MHHFRFRSTLVLALFFAFVLLPPLLVAGCGSKSKSPAAPPAATCQFSSSTVDFGTLPVGGSDTLAFVLTNTSSDLLTVDLSPSCGDFSVLWPTSFAVGGGQPHTVQVRFQPGATGDKACNLDLGAGCGTVALRGRGRTARSSVNPERLDFGRSHPEERQGFWLTNAGPGTLAGTVTSPSPSFALFGPASYSLSPGQDQLFQVSFTPSVSGPQSCEIQTGAADSPIVTCTGFGQLCAVSPTTPYFGTAWHWVDRAFSITNTDSFTLVGSVSENYGEITVSPATIYNLAPGATQAFTVSWTPQLPVKAGSHLYLVDTGLGTCADVACTSNGDAVDAVLSGGCIFPVAGTATDFGTIQVGQPVTLPLSLTNSCGGGEDPYTVNLVEFSGDLSASPALFTNFAPGETRTSQITFTPSQSGIQYLRVQIVSGNPSFASRPRAQLIYRATILP